MKTILLITSLITLTFSHAGEIVLRQAMPHDDLPKNRWWHVYNDDVLDTYLKQASVANQDIKTAVLRFDQARASARVARSDFFPTGNISAGITEQTTSGNTTAPFDPHGQQFSGTTFSVPLEVSYEIDLFGRVRLGYQAAVNDAAAAAATMQNIILTTQAELAQNYFGIRSLDAEVSSVQSAIVLLKELQSITLAKQKSGTATEMEVNRANAELASQQAELSTLQAKRDQLQNAIALLMGRKPQGFSIKSYGEKMIGIPTLPKSVPSDLLERRPDIAASQRNLNASLSRLGVAKLAGYPSLTLGGTVGVSSGSISTLFNQGSEHWSFGPRLSIPLFAGGKNQANVEAQTAAADISLAQYRQTILVAFMEVENQLSSLSRLQEQLVHLRTAQSNSAKASGLAKVRYESGIGTYTDSIDASRDLILNNRRVVTTQGQQLIASVTLIKALGGGWTQKIPTRIPVTNTDPDQQTNPNNTGKKKNFFQKLFSKEK